MINDYKKWDDDHKKYFTGSIIYDDWLDKYMDIICNTQKAIIDLGCGTGNNSLYLLEKDKQVIACDYSKTALEIINKHLPSIKTYKFNMIDKFPLKDKITDIIIADLSLHYFSYSKTKQILEEMKRILTDNGYLFFRVNSINDVNHGAGENELIEANYFIVNGLKKRFFDNKDLVEFFKDWEFIDLEEEIMCRYNKPKIVWKGVVKKKQFKK